VPIAKASAIEMRKYLVSSLNHFDGTMGLRSSSLQWNKVFKRQFLGRPRAKLQEPWRHRDRDVGIELDEKNGRKQRCHLIEGRRESRILWTYLRPGFRRDSLYNGQP
jgi:hypothetical protein